MHFPVDRGERKGERITANGPSMEGGEESMVAISNRFADSRGGTVSGLGITATKFANSYIVRMNPMECLSERRMLVKQPISTFIMGSKHTTKLNQVFQPTVVFSLLVVAQEMEMGYFSTT